MRRMNGMVTGVVTNVEDKDGQGRVKLKFHKISDTTESPWTPIAAPMSGGGRGAFFMPEVGDEVLVAFEDGDFDHPFVVGFLWNGQQKIPETNRQNRVIHTPGGHQLRFEDAAGGKKVRLISAAGHHVTLDDSTGQIIVKTAGGGSSITMDETSVTMIGGGRGLKMAAGQIAMF